MQATRATRTILCCDAFSKGLSNALQLWIVIRSRKAAEPINQPLPLKARPLWQGTLMSMLRVRFQHLLGVLERRFTHFRAAQHPSDFFGALVAGNLADRGSSAIACLFLFDPVVVVGEGCDLRQMGYAKN